MLQALSDHWFLTEPAFFALYCQQQLEENVRMDCAVRCGQGRLEYNPLILRHKNFAEVEQLMRIEMIRLFLKHPYEREPEGCCRQAMAIGSDITIADGYCTLHKEKLPLHTPGYYHLPLGQYYEWYAKAIQQQQGDDQQQSPPPSASDSQSGTTDDSHSTSTDPSASSDGQSTSPSADADRSALWREDALQRQRIDSLIERTTDWGTLPADIVERIKASTKARIDHRQVWQGFHGAVLSSHRQLTRMRPNRRTGFLQMGSTRQFDTHLLVAIDVSGSITTQMLADFYSAINRLFRYGVVQIDLCQFDAQLGPITPMQRANTEVEVHGRGGTSYQPLFDLLLSQRQLSYDGVIILTDGQAPPPTTQPHATLPPILWVCSDLTAYQQSHLWMQRTGRCTHL